MNHIPSKLSNPFPWAEPHVGEALTWGAGFETKSGKCDEFSEIQLRRLES